MSYEVVYRVFSKKHNRVVYVGQTIQSIKRRWTQHIYDSKKLKYPFHFAIQKYGAENFIIEIICECENLEDLNIKEVYYTEFYEASIDKNGYVCIAGGGKLVSEKTRKLYSETRKGENNSHYGKPHSEEVKKRMSEMRVGTKIGEDNSFYGKKHTEEVKQKMSTNHSNVMGTKNPMYGKNHTEETKRKISENRKGKNSGSDNPLFGKKHTEEARRKMSESKKRRDNAKLDNF